MSKEKAPSDCLPIIMLDSDAKVKKMYYSQNFWKNANMKQKRLKWRTLLMII